ncbi:MAG: hypothetical protein HRU69_02735 [Flammeovirgaceae bacterium]|nr:MAG: hypothetical protein HRU69_02735 [Flammeovirgaceae bacterium]
MRQIAFLVSLIFSFTVAGAQQKINYPKGASLIKLYLKNGEQYTGILMDAGDTGMTIARLSNLADTEEFTPDEIYRLEIRKVNSVKRNTLIGAGIGFTLGFAIGWDEFNTGSGTNINQLGHAAGSGLLGAFAGGFIGFITGTATKTFYILGNPDQYKSLLPKLHRYKPANDES